MVTFSDLVGFVEVEARIATFLLSRFSDVLEEKHKPQREVKTKCNRIKAAQRTVMSFCGEEQTSHKDVRETETEIS